MKQNKRNPEGHRSSLKNIWMGDCDFITISSRDLSALPLLVQAYDQLYVPAFGSDGECEDLDGFLKGLKDADPNVEFHVVIAGDNLRKSSQKNKAVLKGMSVSLYFKNEDVGYLSYIVVDPAHRREGLGQHIFQIHQHVLVEAAARRGKSLKGSFLDCTKPGSAHADHDEYGAARRIAKYKKWGGKEVPFSNYILPSIVVEGQKIADWTLMTFPHPKTNQYPDSKAVKEIIKALYKFNGVAKPKKDPDFKAMRKETKDTKFSQILACQCTKTPCQVCA